MRAKTTEPAFDVNVSLSALTDLVGSNNHSTKIPGAEMLGLACNAIDAAVDELDVLRHAFSSDQLDNDKLDLVLARLANRMRIAAAIAWSNDPHVEAVREAAEKAGKS